MFSRLKPSGPRLYLQLVESSWQDGRTHQRVLCTLGRYDALTASGQLDALLASGSRLSETLSVLTAHKGGDLEATPPTSIGPVLVFEKLWKETACQKVLERLLSGRKFEFEVERAVFVTVLHRLLQRGSDRSALEWKEQYAIEGTWTQLSTCTGLWLFWVRSCQQRNKWARRRFPRCVKDRMEGGALSERQDLFNSLELVFFDTTSIYFEGEGGQTLGQRGHNRITGRI